ncbi:uncharacterized protein RAG0_02840 [Rhynchosporium agropyri]|uniref:C2H2-type domain-containing protein n=1 Tax=Rhynchosporium agropyri TaxID=914238 RepID=A0A1E1K2S0_9HELO|nr:uncharacterized protein RAG0_02840 [Rhynchosporium agropyri]
MSVFDPPSSSASNAMAATQGSIPVTGRRLDRDFYPNFPSAALHFIATHLSDLFIMIYSVAVQRQAKPGDIRLSSIHINSFRPSTQMETSSTIQSCDWRAPSSAISQITTAPQYSLVQTCSVALSRNTVVGQQGYPFCYGGYSLLPTNIPVPSHDKCYFTKQQPLPRAMRADDEENYSQSPFLESQSTWPSTTIGSVDHCTETKTSTASQEIRIRTEVDSLMKVMQVKSQTTEPQAVSIAKQIKSTVSAFHTPFATSAISQTGMYTTREKVKYKLTRTSSQKTPVCSKNSTKRYQCKNAKCEKSFHQEAHLNVHERSHTGAKPYLCKEPYCGRTFSQVGNLKTNELRHTGERPHECEICGKRFAQRGNVRAHKLTHNVSKPFQCRLDECRKYFTQLGNLKFHQNKYHQDTIRNLTAKFASTKEGDVVHVGNMELWQYFANLYKNSNKGIKGRDKGRKVGSASNSACLFFSSGMSSFRC